MLILQGMGEFRASLISSATAYHPEPERERDRGREAREREAGGGRESGKTGEKVVGGWKQGEGGERIIKV